MKGQTYLPLPDMLTIRKSNIHGLGVFATKTIPSHYEFGVTHVADPRFQDGYIRTPLGGFVNHSDIPNCEFFVDADTIKFRTIRTIQANEELTAKYILYKPT